MKTVSLGRSTSFQNYKTENETETIFYIFKNKVENSHHITESVILLERQL